MNSWNNSQPHKKLNFNRCHPERAGLSTSTRVGKRVEAGVPGNPDFGLLGWEGPRECHVLETLHQDFSQQTRQIRRVEQAVSGLHYERFHPTVILSDARRSAATECESKDLQFAES